MGRGGDHESCVHFGFCELKHGRLAMSIDGYRTLEGSVTAFDPYLEVLTTEDGSDGGHRGVQPVHIEA